jgi:hypothetical protein
MDNNTQKPPRKATEAQARAGRENLLRFNASRGGKPNLKHGIRTLAETGELPPVPGAEEAAARVDSLMAQFVSDLGGEAQITAGRRTILASQRLALLVLELSSRYLAVHGLLDEKGRPHPLLHVANSYGNTARLNAVALGLERASKTIMSLESVMEEYRHKRADKSHEVGGSTGEQKGNSHE